MPVALLAVFKASNQRTQSAHDQILMLKHFNSVDADNTIKDHEDDQDQMHKDAYTRSTTHGKPWF